MHHGIVIKVVTKITVFVVIRRSKNIVIAGLTRNPMILQYLMRLQVKSAIE